MAFFKDISAVLDRVTQWAADEVQKTTGETDRRKKVDELKELAESFKKNVEIAVGKLNQLIAEFNGMIGRLNEVRVSDVMQNVDALSEFLGKFGYCKPAGVYAQEAEKLPREFPRRSVETMDKYIADVDWTKDDVFANTFLLSPLGMRIKTRSQNLAMQERYNEFQLQIEETCRKLEEQCNTTVRDKEICNMYIENVKFISDYISTWIFPELSLIEAFFQAEEIKSKVLCEKPIDNLRHRFQITAIEGTPYDRHYRFVKNAFMFYVISCKIYNTPVLTNLLNHQTTEEDKARLEKKIHDMWTET